MSTNEWKILQNGWFLLVYADLVATFHLWLQFSRFCCNFHDLVAINQLSPKFSIEQHVKSDVNMENLYNRVNSDSF